MNPTSIAAPCVSTLTVLAFSSYDDESQVQVPGAASVVLLALVALQGATACGAEQREAPVVLDPGVCVAGEGTSPHPRSIAETVALINSMPRPLTLSCFLRALKRPLAVQATDSAFSAQPAQGAESPRLFLFNDPLYLSVVPDGVSRDLLELSELTSATRSIKAEIVFPINELLPLALAYERVLYMERDDQTSCGVCHRQEQPVDSADGPVFESMAFKPLPRQRVELEFLVDLSEQCEVASDNDRCDMLRSLFLYGPVEDHEFPDDMPFFF